MATFSSPSSFPLLLLTTLLSLLLLLPFAPVSSQGVVQLGWEMDPTASGVMELASEAALDLHCNPVQQFSSLPAAGGLLLAFATAYDPSSTTVTGICRLALYQVLANNSYQLLAATSSAGNSDISLPPSRIAGPVALQNGGSLYYPYGGPVTLLPSLSYSLCFTTYGALQYVNGTTVNGTNGLNGTVAQYRWADSLTNHALVPYDIASPLPNPLTFTASQTSSGTWQMWMNVAIGNYTTPSSSSALGTSARVASSSVSSSPRLSSSATSAATVTSAAAAGGGGTVGGMVWELGFKTDATATSPISAGREMIFDLHCNPPQQFTTLPASGAQLLNFVTNYDPTLTTVSGICRMALYQVISSSSYTLLAGTSAALGSDLPLGPGTTPGPVTVSNPGSLYFPNGPVTLLPTLTYSLCFINNGANLYVNGTTVNGTNGVNGTIAQYHWSDSLQSNNLMPYDIASPLPNPLTFTVQSPTTWQIWLTAANASTSVSISAGASSAGSSSAALLLSSSVGKSSSPAVSSSPAMSSSPAVSSSAAVSSSVAVSSPAAPLVSSSVAPGSALSAAASTSQPQSISSPALALTSATALSTTPSTGTSPVLVPRSTALSSTSAAATSAPATSTPTPASSTAPASTAAVLTISSSAAATSTPPATATSAPTSFTSPAAVSAGSVATSAPAAGVGSSSAPTAPPPTTFVSGAVTTSSVSAAVVICLTVASGLSLFLL